MTYSFSYDGNSRPAWIKTFTASSGETFSVNLTFDNEEDRLQLTQQEAFGYMDMVIQYAKDVVSSFSVIQINEEPPENPFPVKGKPYKEYDWAMETLTNWWFWAYFNDDFEFDREPVEEAPADDGTV